MTLVCATCPVCHEDIAEKHVVNGSRDITSKLIRELQQLGFDNHPLYSPQCTKSELWKIENIKVD